MSLDLNQLMGLIQLAPSFKPIVQQVFDAAKEYESEFEQVRDFAISNTVKYRSGIYKGLIAEGIPAEHALVLTVGSMEAVKLATNSLKTKSSK